MAAPKDTLQAAFVLSVLLESKRLKKFASNPMMMVMFMFMIIIIASRLALASLACRMIRPTLGSHRAKNSCTWKEQQQQQQQQG